MKRVCTSACALLLFVLILVDAFTPYLCIHAEEKGHKMDLFSQSDKQIKTKLNVPFGIQFNSLTSFTNIEIYIANATRRSTVRLTLYRWNNSYPETISYAPLYEYSKEDNFVKDTYITWDLSKEQPAAGEYLLVIEKSGSGTIDLNIHQTGKDNVRVYEGTSKRGGSIEMSIMQASSNGLGKLSDNNYGMFTEYDTYVATDGLGRTIHTTQKQGKLRKDKYVGLFFHTWHTHNHDSGMRNITNILKEHPEIIHDYKSEYWGTGGVFFWNEPIYGYYRTDDRWVLRRQAEMLANAGVDVILFDNTNNTFTFKDEVLVLLETFAQARTDGVKTPQISFVLPIFNYDFVAIQLRELYNEIYSQGRYQELWFYWKGKPLIMGYPGWLVPEKNAIDAEIMDFFTFKPPNHSHTWDNVQVRDENGNPIIRGAIQPEVKDNYTIWNWISIYPQLMAKNADGTAEQVTVSIAQNWNAKRGLTAMNGENVYGRHYSVKKGKYDTRENAKLYGVNFQEQWEYALDIDPEFIFITGWNEWVAGRFESWGDVANGFPDQFSDEYSRDIEPSVGDLKDHYYYQMVHNIRRFKGTNPIPKVSDKKTIDIYSELDMWNDVLPNYVAYRGNTFDRDFTGYIDKERGKALRYENRTGRNDIVGAKVTRDNDNIYFVVECADKISPESEKAWMRLLIDIEGVNSPNWETFEYIVNRKSPINSKAKLEKCTGGWTWKTVGDVDYSVNGNRLQLKVPKSMLGIKNDKFVINFKWSDNMQNDGDIMDFYLNGDVAPGGRFKYQYATYIYEESSSVKNILLQMTSVLLILTAGAIPLIRNIKKKRLDKH